MIGKNTKTDKKQTTSTKNVQRNVLFNKDYLLSSDFHNDEHFPLGEKDFKQNFEGNNTNNRNSNTKLNDLVASIPFAMFNSSISSFNRAQSAWS